MSYYSRVYRQRNPKPQEESKESPFFSKKKQDQKNKNNNSFFQAKQAVNEPGDKYEKEADSLANSVVNQGQGKSVQKKEETPVQRLATTPEEEKVSGNDERMERDKEKPFQLKHAEQDKEKENVIQKMDDSIKEKDKEKNIKKMGEDENKDKETKKKDDLLKEKDENKQKGTT